MMLKGETGREDKRKGKKKKKTKEGRKKGSSSVHYGEALRWWRDWSIFEWCLVCIALDCDLFCRYICLSNIFVFTISAS